MLWSRFFPWLTRPKSSASRSPRRPSPWPRHRLAVETLNDRVLPSVLTVVSNNDSGTGSLRECISVAADGDTITFSPTVQAAGPITLQSVLAINKNITIVWPNPGTRAAGTVAINGNNSVEIFSIDQGNTVTLSGLTLENARSALGALDVNNNASNVTLVNDIFQNNTGTSSGGGLTNFATLTVDHSTFIGNHGAAAGGILNGGQLTVLNSTFTGGMSDQYGGGICETSNAGVKLVADTIANNQAAMQGGGVYISESPQYVNFLDTVIAKNTAAVDPDFASPADAVASVTALNNFIGIKGTSNGINNGANGNIVGVGTPLDPLLGPLQYNGGTTPTLAPQTNSPLLGKGKSDPSLGSTDQNGNPRAFNGRIDIGAVEYQGVVVAAVQDIFAIGLDDQVYGHKLDASGSPTGGYFLTQAGRVKALVVGHTPNGNAEVFVIGLDNQVYAQKFNTTGDSASGYFLVQAGQVKTLTLGYTASGSPELFVIGLDNQVYAQDLDANGNSTGGYFLVQTGQIKQLAIGQDAAARPELFVIGLDNQVYAQKLDVNGNSTGGYFLTQPGQVKSLSVTHDSFGNPALAVIGLDNQVYAQSFDASGSSASGWFLVQAGQVKSLVAAHDGNGNPEVFVIGLDNQVYAQRFNSQGQVGGYFLTQPGQVKSLEVGSDPSGDPLLCVVGLDNQVYEQKFDASGLSASGYFLTDVGAVLAANPMG